MDKVTAVRRHISREQWKSLIAQCRASGMTAKAWCDANGICEQTYYKHLKQLREELIDSLPAPGTTLVEADKPVAFKKLEVQTPATNTKAAVIIRLNGASVEIADGTSQQTIQAVLLALQSVC